jgi:protein TIF31
LFKNPIEAELNKISGIKCIESIQFSSFNPVLPYRKLAGDLFYLTIKTVEGNEVGVTSSTNGFYRNDNIEK